MTAVNLGSVSELFVTNVLGGILGKPNPDGGTVQRLVITTGRGLPRLLVSTRIGSGFPARTDPNALVIGPTGVGFAGNTLYVADTLDNRIAAIPDAGLRGTSAGPGRTVTKGGALNGPLGLAIAPNGNILTVNGDDGNIVETTPFGRQAAVKTIDNNSGGGGNLFGLAVKPGADAVYFVDDFGSDNNLQLFH
jgi:DNA-binding beta-propeller fold protein YncE